MKRFVPVIALVIAAVVLGAVNATVFAYRWMQGKVTVEGPAEARGAACVGFYSSATQSGISTYLPEAGTNYNAQTYGTNYITVTPGQIVCEWTVGATTHKLYEGITVEIPITVGSWYIKDFYGFGYYGGTTPVYVYIKVEQSIADSNIATAYLYIYNASSDPISLVTRVNLLNSELATIKLNPGIGLQLDLFINATATATTTAEFKVGFYATYSSTETPR